MPRAYIRQLDRRPERARRRPGYGTGAMPEDYAARIEPAELDALVAFLARSAR